MSTIEPFIIEIKPHLNLGNALTDVASIKLVTPSTHLSIPLAIEKVS
ncbi:TPA: DNA polymerase V, partial [Acinetobacter baumannii]|nr:DNA polymerase V [Acinetobacter baumannii]